MRASLRPKARVPLWMPLRVGALCALLRPTTGLLESGNHELPDFDCRENDRAELLWDDLLAFAASLQLYVDTGCAHISGCAHSNDSDIWESYLEAVFRDDLAAECPMAAITVGIARWAACLLTGPRNAEPRCATLRVPLSKVFQQKGTQPAGWSMPVLMNTRWMHLFCSFRQRLGPVARRFAGVLDPTNVVGNIFDCPPKERSTLLYPEMDSGVKWEQYLVALERDRLLGSHSWTSARWTSAPAILDDPLLKLNECCYGYTTAAIEKLLMVQALKTEQYDGFAEAVIHSFTAVDGMIERYQDRWRHRPADSLTVLMLTRWPVLDLLCYLSQLGQARRPDLQHGYQYKPYDLDFKPEEITGNDEPLQPASFEQHAAALRALRWGRNSPAYRVLLAGLEVALQGWSKVVFVTIAWGERLAQYLPGAVARMRAFGHSHRYLIFCLDGAFCDACEHAHRRELCVPGRLRTIFNKYTVLSAIVRLGFDAVYLDFDTLLLRDPLPHLLEASASAEVLVARDFGGECLNTGVIYFKSGPETVQLLGSLLSWLWHHPYEFSQKAFSALLGHERVSLWSPPAVTAPRWGVLEPLNAFVTSVVYNRGVEGWTGNLEDILIYHFLDGTGGVDDQKAEAGRYVNLYDLFYANPRLDLGDATVPLWQQDPEVERHLLSTRLPGPPLSLHPCRLLPEEDEEAEAESQQ